LAIVTLRYDPLRVVILNGICHRLDARIEAPFASRVTKFGQLSVQSSNVVQPRFRRRRDTAARPNPSNANEAGSEVVTVVAPVDLIESSAVADVEMKNVSLSVSEKGIVFEKTATRGLVQELDPTVPPGDVTLHGPFVVIPGPAVGVVVWSALVESTQLCTV
jgi:hypothetical protein